MTYQATQPAMPLSHPNHVVPQQPMMNPHPQTAMTHLHQPAAMPSPPIHLQDHQPLFSGKPRRSILEIEKELLVLGKDNLSSVFSCIAFMVRKFTLASMSVENSYLILIATSTSHIWLEILRIFGVMLVPWLGGLYLVLTWCFLNYLFSICPQFRPTIMT